ncbi:dimethylsulfonioproprionate lyase family protein [Sinorhizobium americanum]|uniref:Transcriptional regulator protein n=1 Tax=Sinorhizobium americanum TaxID=194963 RepID=A0A1L3LZN6_9HYPH|nr:dimethylsulfonioproprionate lyase family protein [Sinorhizobium americanum]APG95506.1 transcriptional regulator protein [Sinorhizobium americanum]OAP45991.1 transcriptional regulator [Sinorhizobium americanum]
MHDRSPLVSAFVEAARSALSSATVDGATKSALAKVFGSISSGRPLSASRREMFPVCALVDPLLEELEGKDERLGDLAKTLRPLLSHLGWRRREGGPNASDNFMDGHATGMIIGPGGAEDRHDVWVGLTIMRPNVRYPDHSHPPEEVYLALSNGEFRQDEAEWFDPGIGGVFHSPPGIVHGMRSGEAPMLALWLLPIVPKPSTS